MRRTSPLRTRPLARAAAVLTALAVLLLVAAPAMAEARMLRQGDHGPDVRALNARLSSLGYLPATATASPRYDAATAHAVMAVQKWHGLQRDSIAGPVTQAALRRGVRPTPRTAGTRRRIEVLLGQQLALLVERGVVKRTIAVSTGTDGFRTPPGTFEVFRKERRSWSVPYRVWLPWASYFVGGVAFHEHASVPPYPASHGCVRVPAPFAREVFRFASIGTRVVVRAPRGQIGGDEAPVGPYGP